VHGESRELLARTSHLIEAANAIDFQVSDQPGALSLAAISAPTIRDTVVGAVSLLKQVEAYYEEVVDPETAETLFDIGALISAEMAAREITDLAFVAGRELRTCVAQLDRSIETEDLIAMVSGCDTAVRRLRRALIPIEGAMCEFHGVEAPIRRWVDLEVSLRIRRLYMQFGRAVAAVADDEIQMEMRLAFVASRVSNIRSSDLYPCLRIEDRLEMQKLFSRIVGWLDEGEERDPSRGFELWQDVRTFAALLTDINNRQELREHDRKVACEAVQRLFVNERTEPGLPEDLRLKLQMVLGRDEDLDASILCTAQVQKEQLEVPLRRICHRLAVQNG
jgi:hypothetical protein